MKFSFIIGTINRTRELKYCIESLLTQSYREFEIIIVDQSENDLTEKLVKAFSGFEDEVSIPTGIMACEKNFPLFTKLLEDYDNRHFILQDGKFDLTTNVVTITNLCKKYGFIGDDSRQDICGFILYPHDVFCPKSHVTGIISLTNRTVTIHHFSGSWKNKEAKISIQIKRKLDNKGPAFHIIAKVVAFPFTYSDRAKNEGVGKATHYYIRKIVKKIIIQKRGRNHI